MKGPSRTSILIHTQPMNIAGYQFQGPYPLTTSTFNAVGAVYVISDVNNSAIDVGQTDNLKDRMANHVRKNCWLRNAVGEIRVYALVQNDEKTRLAVESLVRNGHKFSCGVF